MATKKTTAKTADVMDDFSAFGADAFKEGYARFAEGMSGFAEMQKTSAEAFMASAGAVAKGFEKITAEQTTFAKAAFEDSVSTAKEASVAKSFQEAIDLNSEFVRTTVEKNMGQMTKLAEIWTETAKESAEPLTAQYNEMIEKMQAFRP